MRHDRRADVNPNLANYGAGIIRAVPEAPGRHAKLRQRRERPARGGGPERGLARPDSNPLAGSPHMPWRESSSHHRISSRAFAESLRAKAMAAGMMRRVRCGAPPSPLDAVADVIVALLRR